MFGGKEQQKDLANDQNADRWVAVTERQQGRFGRMTSLAKAVIAVGAVLILLQILGAQFSDAIHGVTDFDSSN